MNVANGLAGRRANTPIRKHKLAIRHGFDYSGIAASGHPNTVGSLVGRVVDLLRSGINRQTTAQAALVNAFAVIRRTGLLESGAGRWAFENAYLAYKRLLEAGQVNRLAAYVMPGSTVIDVGANIGFFTTRFALWVGPQGRVVAIEPETINASRLRLRLARRDLLDRVEVIQAAACEKAGTVMLEINPDHPGDHKLAGDGVPTPGVTLDDIVAKLGCQHVSLIKIDVQGAEQRVIAGSEATIRRCRPALFIEIDDEMLRRQGSSAASLIETVTSLGYSACQLGRKGFSRNTDEVLARISSPSGGYTDLLFLPVGASAR